MSNSHDIFNKFSPNARKILIAAQKIAQSMGTALGSEHILLSLAITPKTLAQSILREQMVSLDQIRLIISLHHFTNEPTPGMTAEAKDALKVAAQTAAEFNHSQIDSEHLLWAVLAQDNFHAAEIVDRIGTDPEAIIDQIKDYFDEMDEPDSSPKPNEFKKEEPNFNFSMPQENFPADLPGFPPMQKVNIDNFTVDLTSQAREGKIDPVVGREREIERLIQILGRRTKNNPVLVGEPGVGKTAIIEGLARRIVEKNVPASFYNKKVIMLDLALLIAGTMYRGQFEERIKKVVDAIIKDSNTILFIDELHTIVGAGAAEGSQDVANILKPALAKGKLHLVGATTFDEYRKFIEKDAALERRLQKIVVEEPSPAEAKEILKGIKDKYEAHHGVNISDEAVEAAVDLSVRYINDRNLPDKAIDLIDEAASSWQLKHTGKNLTEKMKLEAQLSQIRAEKEREVEAENFPKAANLRTLELRLEEQIKNMPSDREIHDSIGRAEIAKIVSTWTNVPVEALKIDEKVKYKQLASNLKKQIVGQNEAVDLIAAAIKRTKSGLADPNRPIGSFIFLGPTGVGKTELARVLAQELFGSRDALIKIDMSEFAEQHNVSRLVGAPPGYVGYEEAGKLTEQVRQKPYSIILFDEIEKAHREVFNILLQILEDGVLTDARGRKVSFKNTIIIMTSNIGMEELNHQAAIGFTANAKKSLQEDYEKMKDEVVKRLKTELRPEFINRLDKIVVFRPLSKPEIEKIAELQLNQLAERLLEQGYNLKFSANLAKYISNVSFDLAYGARPLRRAITDLIENPLSELILAGKFKSGDTIKISVKSGKIDFSPNTKR